MTISSSSSSSSTHFDANDSQLVADLYRISQKSPRLIRSTVYAAPSDPAVKIRSWKFNEFKYYDVPSPFPTLARGLFTRELKDEAGGGEGEEKEGGGDRRRYQIVARGYDKFFNIGEVPWTDWSSLEAHSCPPYTLSVKSNGCIIFVAAITPSKLIVTSKHALGEMQGVAETHSQAGHRWLVSHIASKRKTEEQLAAALWAKNWTAVAELCDDEFEEHVLAYPPEKSGLYLHGINETRRDFHTLPTRIVDEFADEFGFLKTPTIVYDTLAQVKSVTEEVAKTGKWRGEPLEGFVVRTSIVDSKPGATSYNRRPPYPTGSSFFFKVKFDEPYMMYRDWREVTKSLLSTTGSLNDPNVPKSKLKRKETQVYLKWVKNEIRTNRSAFEGYAQGKGIIATRERFLRWLDTEQGKTDLSGIKESQHAVKKYDKTVILPVAIPGCGKTSVSVALSHLFDFGHTQSDDVQTKKSAPVFLRNVVDLLGKKDVVIADKNNHLRQHREELRKAINARIHSPVRLLALNWSLDLPRATIFRVCGDRILGRGDKHQSLRADKDGKSHEEIIWQFIRQTEELGDSEVDETIEMDVREPLEAAVARAVDGCVAIFGLERPSQERIDEAVAIARDYAPTIKRNERKKKDKSPSSPRFFAILAELDVEALVASQIERAEDVPYNGQAFWRKLTGGKDSDGDGNKKGGKKDDDEDEGKDKDKAKSGRFTRPHVTIVHRAGLPDDADLWDRCATLDRMRAPPLFTFTLGHLVWNDRVMALTVDDLELAEEPGDEDHDADPVQEKHEFISKLPAEVREVLHITVGTADANVPAYEAKGLVEAWRRGRREGIGALELEGPPSGKGRIRGLMS